MLFEKLLLENELINEDYRKIKQGRTIALLGNPNVGKSTVFNALTGMNQHTGNWPGKTVELACGYYVHDEFRNKMIDLPGTYSLLAHSSEEEVTRNYICFENCDICIVVCDATCLERNLNLVLQTLEITQNVVLVLNMMDEAKKKKIHIDSKKLSSLLKIPVVEMSATKEKTMNQLKETIQTIRIHRHELTEPLLKYEDRIEKAIHKLSEVIVSTSLPTRFLAIKIVDPHMDSSSFLSCIKNREEVQLECEKQRKILDKEHSLIDYEKFIVKALQESAHSIAQECVQIENRNYQLRDLQIDRILTHKYWGFVWMILLLCVIFWITIYGANLPSELLSEGFLKIESSLHIFLNHIHVSAWLQSFLVDGVVQTMGWVIAVMLPPMAIFFPLFTILEDFGYLPRIAFNLDGFFQKAHTCGKQALTMCMGFGCNAVGVSGARIIDSPRERLIAILTNVFVPCNGRFPTLISIITMFFAGVVSGPWKGILSSLLLSGVILFGIFLTFVVSRFLSKTLLKGMPSSFTLELPPYRKPQFGKVIVRSLLDRTLFVLGRAVSVAIPAGALIWLFANCSIEGVSVLSMISSTLDPFAQLMGLDGVILMAFLLGFPANEIVVPIIIMAYLANGTMMEINDLTFLKTLFIDHGWTWVTALCTVLFSLVHFPCAITLWTIKKETGGWKWTIISFLLPTILGILLCMGVNLFAHLFQLL